MALVTIVSANGSTPQRVGAKMLVYADGRTVGTIGGGCYENEAFWKAREASADAQAAARCSYELTDDFAQESGLICGGQMEVFIEPIEPSRSCTSSAPGMSDSTWRGWRTRSASRCTCVDDREKFANARAVPRRRPRSSSTTFRSGCSAPRCRRTPTSSSSPAAIATISTRCARSPPRDLRYLGLIGSRAKVKRIYDALLEEGMPPESLRRVHAPIGLDIGAVMPEEIAVSILAELIAVRRGKIAEPHVAAVSMRWDKAARRARRIG